MIPVMWWSRVNSLLVPALSSRWVVLSAAMMLLSPPSSACSLLHFSFELSWFLSKKIPNTKSCTPLPRVQLSCVQSGRSQNGNNPLWTGRWHLMCCEEHNTECIWSGRLHCQSVGFPHIGSLCSLCICKIKTAHTHRHTPESACVQTALFSCPCTIGNS